MPDLDPSAQFLSIGALSRATGIPTDTLRTWERRYGFPTAERTESGHRRYSPETLQRLRLVQRAMQLGQPASAAVNADPQALQALIDRALEGVQRPEVRATRRRAEALDEWFALVKAFDGVGLDRALRGSVAALGSHLFLAQRAAPFVTELGERWSTGELGVHHEHFASERLREVLVDTWRPLSDTARRGPVVCATPPSEQHVLGLHMAALTLALEDIRIVFLGADAPVANIVAAAKERSASAVVLSASVAADPTRLLSDVAQLRDALPSEVQIVGGGEGFQAGTRSITVVSNFTELTRWATTLDRD